MSALEAALNVGLVVFAVEVVAALSVGLVSSWRR